MAKKLLKKKNQSKFNQFCAKHITHPKLILILLLMLALPLTSFVYEKYKDWDNARMIIGIAKDFPQLVAEIEEATGLDLEIKKNCMTTTEKFSAGVRNCELSVAKATSQSQIDLAVQAVMRSSVPSRVKLSETKRTYRIEYMNKESCAISAEDTIYVACIVGVRDANIQLARDTF